MIFRIFLIESTNFKTCDIVIDITHIRKYTFRKILVQVMTNISNLFLALLWKWKQGIFVIRIKWQYNVVCYFLVDHVCFSMVSVHTLIKVKKGQPHNNLSLISYRRRAS